MKKTAFILAFVLIVSSFYGCTKKQETNASIDADVSADAVALEKASEYRDHERAVAVIVTDHNECIVFELYADQAPQTVKNFIELANKGFYDGLIFHRVIPGFMIQGGDPEGSGFGGPGYEIFGEFSNNGFNNTLKYTRGVVSMARRGSQTNPSSMYNTAGSQFFICVETKSYLDGDYAAFGKVLEGMDAVDRIVSVDRDPNTNKPLEDQVMSYVRVFENGKIA